MHTDIYDEYAHDRYNVALVPPVGDYVDIIHTG